MNITKHMFRELIGERETEHLENLLNMEHWVALSIFYLGYIISFGNLLIFCLAVYLYRRSGDMKPSFIFIANLSLSDTILPLVSSIMSAEFQQPLLDFNHLYSQELGGFVDHSSREEMCQILMTVFVAILLNAILALVLLTVDRFISVRKPLKYKIIMKFKKIFWIFILNWMFVFAIASSVYSTNNLRKNHVCTFTFAVRREFLVVMLIILFACLIFIFSIYGFILRLFFKMKKDHFENMKKSAESDCINFSGKRLYVIPIKLDPILPYQDGITLKSYQRSEGTPVILSDFKPNSRNQSRSMSSSFIFYLHYIHSSKFVLVLVIAYCIFHGPLLMYLTEMAIRFYNGYYDTLHFEECQAHPNYQFKWFEDYDFYLGDCLRLSLSSSLESDFQSTGDAIGELTCHIASGTVDINSTKFCLHLHQTIDELEALARTVIYYRLSVLNSMVNPLLYAVWYQPFRSGVIDIWTRTVARWSWRL